MTVRLLASYGKYPANAIVTLDAATEAGLIAYGGASASLAGGLAYAAPSVSFAATGPAQVVLDDFGNPKALRGLTADVFIGKPFLLSGQTIEVAWYGDSRAVSISNGTTNAYDTRDWVTTTPTGSVQGGSITFARGGGLTFLHAAIRNAACLGRSGDTLAQMITRESASVSATRQSLDDGLAVGARVLLFKAGINTITTGVAAQGGYLQSNTDAWIALRADLIQRAVARGYFVIDLGEAGYDQVGDATYQGAIINGIRQTISAINTAAKAAAAASNGTVTFIDTFSVLCDSTGQWLPGVCSDTGSGSGATGQRVHLSPQGEYNESLLIAAALNSLFGPVSPSYTRYVGTNLLTNADLSASTAGLATGWAHTGNGTSPVRTPSLRAYKGTIYQSLLSTFGAANSTDQAQLLLPIPIYSGAANPITVAAGERYGFECDITLDDGNGGPPPLTGGGASAFLARIRIYNAAGNVYYDAMPAIGTPFGTSGPFECKLVWPPITMFDSSANLTSSTAWSLSLTNPLGTPIRIAAARPRIVKLTGAAGSIV